MHPYLGWLGMMRLGLVQMALGALVVLTTSTLNRVMVVELAFPAMLPGALVALHYAVQCLRPRWGYGADIGRRRTSWIIGGMAVLALGGVGAALSVALMGVSPGWGIAAATIAFTLIGIGVGAAGTNLLALLAVRVAPERRPAAATIAWLMMIAGIAVTAGISGGLLDPFSPARLVAVSTGVAGIAMLLVIVGVLGIEGRAPAQSRAAEERPQKAPFKEAIGEIWREPKARQFTVFVFASMLAYSAQDLILEPFAGLVFGMTPGESTSLAGVQHGGVFLGMALVGVLATAWGKGRPEVLRAWTVGGCLASTAALLGLAAAGLVGPAWPLKPTVFALGVANGAFAVAAIGSMMALASSGRAKREGTRMGLWGAAQAIAFGLGGFLGTVAVDAARLVFTDTGEAYAAVFALEGGVFLLSALLAARMGRRMDTRPPALATPIAGE